MNKIFLTSIGLLLAVTVFLYYQVKEQSEELSSQNTKLVAQEAIITRLDNDVKSVTQAHRSVASNAEVAAKRVRELEQKLANRDLAQAALVNSKEVELLINNETAMALKCLEARSRNEDCISDVSSPSVTDGVRK